MDVSGADLALEPYVCVVNTEMGSSGCATAPHCVSYRPRILYILSLLHGCHEGATLEGFGASERVRCGVHDPNALALSVCDDISTARTCY